MTPLQRAIADEIVGRVTAVRQEHVDQQAQHEPRWLSYLDVEHQAYLRQQIERGWKWSNFNATDELLMQIITDLRQEKLP